MRSRRRLKMPKRNPSNRQLLLELLERVARLEAQVNLLKWLIPLSFTALGILITFISLFLH